MKLLVDTNTFVRQVIIRPVNANCDLLEIYLHNEWPQSYERQNRFRYSLYYSHDNGFHKRSEYASMTDQTITTTAVGRTSAPPDEVDIQFAARAADPDVTTARRMVADQAVELRQELDDVGIPDERIRTSRFRIRQGPPDRGNPSVSDPETQPYRASETITVVLFELDRLGDVLSAAVDDAGVEINEVAFTFQTETQRDLQQTAITDAVNTARKNATAAAAAENLTVESVQSIVTDTGSHPRQLRAGQALGSQIQVTGSVESGPIEVSVTVEVEYLLEEP